MKKIKSSVKKYWDWRSSSYGCDADKSALIVRQWESAVRQLVKGAPGRRALDIGTGTGQFAIYLARAGFDVTGIDLSEFMIAEAQRYASEQRLRIDFRTGDAESLDFEDQIFDVIVSRNLLWTLPRPRRTLTEWRRVLKPGGRLVVSDGFWMNTTWKNVHRLVLQIIKDRGINGSRISMRFFRAYAGLQKKLPLYEGVSLDSAVTLLQEANFRNVKPYDTSSMNVHPYGAVSSKNGGPPFFIASAAR